jgi:hypothetical protein
MGKTLGIILIAGGMIVGIIVAWLGSVYLREGSLTAGAATLGIAIGFVVLVLPQIGFGVFLLMKGGQEETAVAHIQQQRQLLSIVKSRGQISLSDLILEMQTNKDDVQNMIHHLVGMGLFSGYINWDEGVLYSTEASQLRNMSQCAHCSGQLELVGKGISQCPYCGTEYFLE